MKDALMLIHLPRTRCHIRRFTQNALPCCCSLHLAIEQPPETSTGCCIVDNLTLKDVLPRPVQVMPFKASRVAPALCSMTASRCTGKYLQSRAT